MFPSTQSLSTQSLSTQSPSTQSLSTQSLIPRVLAFTPPSAPPPGDNVAPPLNTGSDDQGKLGDLGIGAASPATGIALDVTGIIESTGAITSGGQVTGTEFSIGSYYLRPNNAATSLYTLGSITALGTTNANYFAGNVGIGTTAPTNILSFGSDADKKIWIESSTNTVAGKALTISAGSTVNYGGDATFNTLNQANKVWWGITAAPNGNVYATTFGGDIYMQTGGTGNFIALSQTSRNWIGVAAAPNGNVYAAAYSGDIYMQTGGTGNFVALNQTSRGWWGMGAASNGNVYAVVYNGDIYMQTGGTGNFTALNQTTRGWTGVGCAPNGNVYATVESGNIYMQTGGSGNFITLSQTTRQWYGVSVAPNGNAYAVVYNNGDIYMQTGGTGNFIALNQTLRNWDAIAAAPNGNVYATTYGVQIYMQTASVGTADLAGGNLILSSGVGKGTGASKISFYTGTTLGSGTDIQTLSEKMTILGSGNVGIGTAGPRTSLHIAKSGDTIANLNANVANNGLVITSNFTAGADYAPGIVWSSEDNNPTKNKAGIFSQFSTTGTTLHFGVSKNYANGISNEMFLRTSTSDATVLAIDTGAVSTAGYGLLIGDGTATSYLYLGMKGVYMDTYYGQGGSTIMGQTNNPRFVDASAYPFTLGTIGAQPLILGTNNTERIRILSSGNVGIGTTNPNVGFGGSTLTVYGSGTNPGIITAARDANSVGWGTGFQSVLDNSAGTPTTYSYFNGYIITNTAGAENGGLAFYTMKSGTVTEQMRIIDTGNVGIGTIDPETYKLKVQGDAKVTGTLTASGYTGTISAGNVTPGSFASNATPGNYTFTNADKVTPILYIDAANNRVGIGTASPGAKLDVRGETRIGDGTNYARIDSDGDFNLVGTADYLVDGNRWAFRYSANEGYGLYFDITNYEYGFWGGNVQPTIKLFTVNALTGNTYILGKTGIGTTNPGSSLSVNGGISAGSYSATAAPSNGMIISGNVGIGTTNPLSRLDVNGNVGIGMPTWEGLGASAPLHIYKDNGASIGTYIKLETRGYTGEGSEIDFGYRAKSGAIGVIQGTSGIYGSIYFSTGDGTTLSEKMRILNNGNVGIGTTSPGGLLGLKNANTYLDVDGSNNLTFTDIVTGTKTLAQLATGGGGGIGTYVGATSSTYSGNNNNNNGYAYAHARCAAAYTGSHVCAAYEILNTIASGGALPAQDVWIFIGPPGYTALANDCDARTRGTSAAYGAYWQKPGTGYPEGRGLLMRCDYVLRLACCM